MEAENLGFGKSTTVRPEDGQGFPIVVHDEDIPPEIGPSVQDDDNTIEQAQSNTSDEGVDGKAVEKKKEKSNLDVICSPTTEDNTRNVAIGQLYNKLSYGHTETITVTGSSNRQDEIITVSGSSNGDSSDGQDETITVSCNSDRQDEINTVRGSSGCCRYLGGNARPETKETNFPIAKPSLPLRPYPRKDDYLFSEDTVTQVTKDNRKRKLMDKSSSGGICLSEQEQILKPQVEVKMEQSNSLTDPLKAIKIEKMSDPSTVALPALEYLNTDTNLFNTSGENVCVKDSLRNMIQGKGVKSSHQSTKLDVGTSGNRCTKSKKRKQPSRVAKPMESKGNEQIDAKPMESKGNEQIDAKPMESKGNEQIDLEDYGKMSEVSTPGRHILTSVSTLGPNIPIVAATIPTTVNCISDEDECPSPKKKLKGKRSKRK